MIYSVICTDNGANMHWQSELLEYSWSKVNQAGELWRLVSCDDRDELPEHRHAKVIRTRPTSVHPQSGDHYVPYNRLFSFRQWLDEYQPNGTVFVLDPDCVFRKPLNIEVREGSPIGQHWLDFGVSEALRTAMDRISNVRVEDLQPLTWPVLMDCNDLRKIISRWIELTGYIRDQTSGWESDMFAFTVACREFDLEFELQNNTAWMPWPDDEVKAASVIHYCQKVLNNRGEQLWWKQSYKPWERVGNAEAADQPYCRDLLRLVDEYAELKRFEETLSEQDTIFIAIASYCEPELVATIESCLTKARRPDRLRFGICLQYDESDPLTSSSCLDRYAQDTRFRYVKYPYTDSTGGSWARNIAQQLYDGERYTLQIDAHSQMLESWDVILIRMMQELPGDKPLITVFPPLYYFVNGEKVYQHVDDLTQVNTMLAVAWSEDGSVRHAEKIIPENNASHPSRTRLLSGAFVFTLGQWNEEVRQDPNHFYTGEEFALTLRSFTHGYDLFAPRQIVVWHRMHPEPNRKFWHDNRPERVHDLHGHALQRLKWLYEGDPENQLGRYGLGTARTLLDYCVYSGIDCENHTIHPDAINGVPPSPSTLTDNPESEGTLNGEAQLLDIRIHLKGVEPLELECDEDNPVLKLLFQSQLDKRTDPDSLLYLNMGENGEQAIHFRKSALIAIETDPPLSEAFFAQLSDEAAADSAAGDGGAADFRFNDQWKYWIWHNIHQRGCSRDVVFKELILNDFPWDAVRRELGCEPSIPLEHIRSLSEQDRSGVNQDKLLIPNVRRISDRLEIYSINNFLTQAECDQLIERICARQAPARTALEERTPEFRTNTTCFFERSDQDCPLADEVTLRISRLLGINPSFAEPLQGHIYGPGQEYKPHADFFAPGSDEFDKHASDEHGGQRTWSVLVYLNEAESGGATEFTNIGLSVAPRMGKVVFWNNLHPSGAPNIAAVHCGKPVQSGRKIVISQWFRSIGSGEMFQRDPQEYIPAYTSTGFRLTTAPVALYAELTGFMKGIGTARTTEEREHALKNAGGDVPSHLLEIPDELRQRIFEQLQPILEKWSGEALLPSAVYGIRRYNRGTSLQMHRDRPKSHIISAIINVAQKVEEQWPLEIEDHYYRTHRVNLAPGDMLLYEGGRLPHGRPTLLQGDYYCNVFVHFRPVNYVPSELLS